MLIFKVFGNALFFTICLFLCASTVKGETKQPPGEEILIAQKLENEKLIWCGNKVLVYEVEETGVFWHNIETGEKEYIADKYASSIGCTPDGEWLIYMDKDSFRKDGKEGHNIVDLWRYEFRTKRKQRFAVADDQVSSFHENSISRDGKIYLPRQPKTRIKMPEPKWEVVWSEFRQLGNPVWLTDSKTVLSESHVKQDIKLDFFLETISPKRKTAVISPQLIAPQLLMIDALNRVYIEVWSSRRSGAKNSILKCMVDTKEEKISCAPFLAREKNISGFELFPDMKSAAFAESGGVCVLRTRFKGETECITKTYPEVSGNFNISPDGKWLAFTIYTELRDEDLYLKRLE